MTDIQVSQQEANAVGHHIGLDGEPGPNSVTHIPRNSSANDWDIPTGWGVVMLGLPFAGQSISRVAFYFGVLFLMHGGSELRIDTAFDFRPESTLMTIDPSTASGFASTLIGLLHIEIEAAKVTDAGALELCFRGNSVLNVAPSDEFEAWTFAGAEGSKVVCMPGGGVTTWGLG